jgi:hypothetical protein
MLRGATAQPPAKPPKPVRRQRGGATARPELDARAAEQRLRESSTKAETEAAEGHLRLLREVELVGPTGAAWIAVTAYLLVGVACGTSVLSSTLGLNAVVSTTVAKVYSTPLSPRLHRCGAGELEGATPTSRG